MGFIKVCLPFRFLRIPLIELFYHIIPFELRWMCKWDYQVRRMICPDDSFVYRFGKFSNSKHGCSFCQRLFDITKKVLFLVLSFVIYCRVWRSIIRLDYCFYFYYLVNYGLLDFSWLALVDFVLHRKLTKGFVMHLPIRFLGRSIC